MGFIMSGGHFDYVNYRIEDAAEELRRVIGDEKYSGKVKKSLEETARTLEEAAIRIREADYLVSGDYGKESYLKALEEALTKLK